MNSNWIYFGVFLDEKSRNKLFQLTDKLIGNEIDNTWKKYCHHMTIAFNNGSENVRSLYEMYEPYFGFEMELLATHIGFSDDAIAVSVEFDGITNNKIPHITLATPQNGKPVNSNYITKWKKMINPIHLTGVLKSFNKKN